MKVTIRSARMDKDGRHNDRNFDVNSASHIDQERMRDNIYYTYNGNTSQTFLELEKEFYENHFGTHIEEQNKRNTAAGHKKRNMSVDDYLKNKRTRPEDVLLQIGDAEEHASGEELWECATRYREKFEELFGEHCKIIDMALHMDEATPHVHIRRVWISEDEQGNEMVSQSRALKDMDIMIPDGLKPEDRFNNQKMTFSTLEREMFTKIVEDEGFIIERSAGQRRRHLSVDEYKEMKSADINISQLKTDIESVIALAMQDERVRKLYEKELKDIEEKSLIERAEIAKEIAPKLQSQITGNNSYIDQKVTDVLLQNELQKMKNFLSEKGLLDEYENQGKESEKEEKRSVTKEDIERTIQTSFF